MTLTREEIRFVLMALKKLEDYEKLRESFAQVMLAITSGSQTELRQRLHRAKDKQQQASEELTDQVVLISAKLIAMRNASPASDADTAELLAALERKLGE